MPDLKSWIPKLAGQRVMVIGDVFLDEYLVGKATRMSREAPVPVLEFESRQRLPGGAANPAANIVSLGSEVIQAGVIGTDSAASNLREVLQTRGIATHYLITDSSRPTTVKTRIMAQMGLRFPQQVARLDTLSREPVNAAIEQQIGTMIGQEISTVGAVLISDYHTGLLTSSLVERVHALGVRNNVLLTADAQGELDKYRGFGIVKCNADEARVFLGRDLRNDEAFAEAARELLRTLRVTVGMVITRGADGLTAATPDENVTHCPAPAITDVYDTVGAGDTTIAVLTLAISAGATLSEAAALANYASGLVVRKVGNYAPTPDELAWALETWRHA
jgi:rfaE bifunctional protein kinase chain/domain